MIKRLTFLALFFFAGIVAAQNSNFAPLGAKWWYSLDCTGYQDCGYYTMTVTKDTTIGAVSARIIEKEMFGGESWSSIDKTPFIVYSEGNKVYNYDKINDEFYVLYDFGLQAGDTLTIQDTTKFRGFYNIEGGTDIALFQVVVDSNVIKSFGNYSLTHLYTSPTANSSYFFNGPIIEHIGNTHSFLGEPSMMTPGGYPGHWRCYKDSLIDLTHNNCEYIANVGINESSINNVSIYPNPTTDIVTIDLADNNNSELFIYQLDGTFIRKQTLLSNNTVISISDLNVGVYLFEVQNDKGTIIRKIVKN